MKRRSDPPADWDMLRAKIIGLGEHSIQKSYYPELQRRLEDLNRFRILLDHSIDGIVLARIPTGALTDVNESMCTQLGYSREELLRMSFADLVLPQDSLRIGEVLSGKSVYGQHTRIQMALRKRKGDPIPAEMTIRPVELGGSLYAVAVIRDITDRKLAEEERLQSYRNLRDSEELLSAIIENIPDMIFVKDAEALKFVRFNKAGEQVLGYSREQMIGKNDYDFFPKEEADFFTAKDHEVLDSKIYIDIPEETILTRSGKERFLHTTKIPILDETGKPQYLLGIAEDITERKLADEAIHQREEQFRSLFMSMRDGFYLSQVIYDDNGRPCDYRYLEVNPTFEEILGIGRDQIIGRTYKEIVPVDTTQWLDNYFTVVRTGGPSTYDFYSDEYKRHFETYSYQPAKDQVCVIIRDITERKQMEEDRRHLESNLFQSQKIESIGTLAGGIAHDFNNILTALMGYATLLQMKMEPDDPLLMYVGEIMSGSQKAAEMTRALLTFSRQQPVNFCPLGINDVIRGTEKLLKRLVTEDVAIKTIFTPDQPVIMADATQIDQILLNLATNARDAMPKGGAFTIETELVELDEQFKHLHGYGQPGSYVLVSFSDNGIGMDEATRERIFDPFFTTKEVGKGTGLGLSTVYGIVKQHDGFITVYSEPGRGTIFRIYFPAIGQVAEKEQVVAEGVKGGREVILIAEDNKAVLDMTKAVLTQYGYSVIAAGDGAEAVEEFRKGGRIDLVILDSVMPRKNGREAYDEISAIDPRVKVLFTSGYTRDIILDKGVEDKKFDFVSKPIQPLTFLKKVREMLDR